VGCLLATPARRAGGALAVLALISTIVVFVSAPAEDVEMPRVLPVAVADQPVTTTTATAPVRAEDEETEAGASAAAAKALAASGAPRKPLVPLGEIRIPKIGLVHTVYEGVTLDVIDVGPGHWPGSAVPGQLGNAVFAGHRVTHTRPFRHLDQLVPGDEVFRLYTARDSAQHYRDHLSWPCAPFHPVVDPPCSGEKLGGKGFWVTHLTWRRKPRGTVAWWGSERSQKLCMAGARKTRAIW
jgi:hypothetical protein